MTYNNKLQVEAIKRGTVIDHIPIQIGFKLLLFFRLTEIEQRITIGLNLPSKKMVQKDLIKIENTFLTNEQISKLAIYALKSTINLIDEYEVVSKITPTLPDKFERVLICPNSNCISHNEPLFSNFFVKQRNNEVYLKCKYCEKEFIRNVVLGTFQ